MKLKRFRLGKSDVKKERERRDSEASTLGVPDVDTSIRLGRSAERLSTLVIDGNSSTRDVSPAPVLGLHEVYSPQHPVADIVFVHGIGGHSHRTWTKDHDPSLFWPESWLPFEPDICDCRILTFGYNAGWKGSVKNISTITDFAKELLYEMRFSRDPTGNEVGIGSRPIVFVVHSMGGLVVKKAYLLGLHDATYNSIIHQISAVVFLSTPHRGTNLAEALNRIISASLQAPKSFISDLTKSSIVLEEINEQFRHIAPNLSVWSFYETLATTVGPRKIIILGKDSAILGYPSEVSRPLQANHQSICKFEGPNDPNYISVKNAIRALVGKFQLNKVKSIAVRPTEPLKNTAVEVFFRDCLTSEDDCRQLQRQRISDTCEWFVNDQQMAPSLQSPVESHVLWYHAPPASGKSVLAAYLVSHMQATSRCCQYFFFRHSDQAKRSVSTALRALACQMSRDIPGFRKQTEVMSLESLALESKESHMIWRNTFEKALFNVTNQSPTYWIIDALDECDSPRSLLECLESIKASSLKIVVIVLSRCTEALSFGFDTLARHVSVTKVDMGANERNRLDIDIFVLKEMEDLAGSQEFRLQLRQKIMNRSEGNFLWTKLVMNEIKDCHTEESIADVLDDMPSDMTELYKRMEHALLSSTKTANKPLVLALLEWTVCAQRALSVCEISQALQPRFSGFLDLKRTIISTCGQFVVVNDDKKVDVLHHTCREYLKSSHSGELHIDSLKTHGKLFEKAISIFHKSSLQTDLIQHQHMLKSREPFLFYSATAWPYHLACCIPESSEQLDIIMRFFRSRSTLSWICILALERRQDVLIKTSRILVKVAKAVRKRDASRNPMLHRIKDLEVIDRWAVDLLKLVGKFGRQLNDNPNAIFGIVPALCPSETAVFQHCHDQRMSNIHVQASGQHRTWSDHLGRISMPEELQAWDISCAAKTLAILASDNIVRIWDTTKFTELAIIAHNEAVTAMAINENASMLMTYGLTTTKLWSVPTATILASYASVSDVKVIKMIFSPNSKRLFSVGDDNSVRYLDCADPRSGWSILDDSLLKETSNPTVTLNSPMWVSFSDDAEYLAVSYRGAPLSVWRLSDGRCLNTCHRKQDMRASRRPSTNWFGVDRFTWNTMTGHVVGVNRDGSVFKWHPITNDMQESPRRADEIAMSPNGKLFATSSSDGSISVWDFSYFTVIYQLASEDLVTGLLFSPDSSRFYDVRGGAVNAWEPNCLARSLESDETMSDANSESQSATAVSKISEARVSSSEAITAIGVSPDGQIYCAGYEDGGINYFETNETSGLEFGRFYNFLSVTHICWSPDGRYIICADLAGDMQLFSVSRSLDNKIVTSSLHPPAIDLESSIIRNIVFSLDSEQVFVQTDKRGYFCSTDTGDLRGTIDFENQANRAWTTHITNSSLLISLTAVNIEVFHWDTRELYGSLRYHEAIPESQPVRDIELEVIQSKSLLVVCPKKLTASNRENMFALMMDDFETSLHLADDVKIYRLPPTVTALIYKPLCILWDSDLVFLDDDLWLHTQNLTELVSRVEHDPSSRHYFIPRDWMGNASLDQCTMSPLGTLYWPEDKQVFAISCKF